ncbi:ribonuclease T2-like [Podila minutissima]|nr:ribonuclease T2-like [Podila minutissima]
MGPMNEFTLHRLWPDKCNGRAANFCDRGRLRWDVKDSLKQTDIYSDIKNYWPSYNPTPQQPDNNLFWSKQWNKHGTCVSTLDPRCGYEGDQDLYAYFNTALALRKDYDIYKSLKKAGISPRPRFGVDPSEEDEYSVDDILAAIKDEWHVKGAVYCEEGKPLEISLSFKVKNKGTYELTDAIPNPEYDCHKRKVVYREKQRRRA